MYFQKAVNSGCLRQFQIFTPKSPPIVGVWKNPRHLNVAWLPAGEGKPCPVQPLVFTNVLRWWPYNLLICYTPCVDLDITGYKAAGFCPLFYTEW